MVKDRVKAEQEQEKAHKKRERRAAVIKGKLYVWGDLTEHDKNDTEHTIVQPQMKKYDPSMRSNTCFFSDVYPDTIFRKIADVFEEQQQDFEISDKKWRVNYNAVKMMKPKEHDIVDDIDREIREMEESKANAGGIEMQEDADI